MAIPFSLPSDDTTLEQYRSIHRLLLDLTAILRTLLARNPEWIRSEAAQNANVNPNANTNPVAPLSLPTFNPATSQFGLPLSPPSSQPGSPSPFLTTTTASTSAFVLPDVVTSATRSLNEFGPQMPTPPPTPTVVTAVPATFEEPHIVASSSISSNIHSQRLRKRKRAKLQKRKRPQETELGHAFATGCVITCNRHQHRKIPKTTNNSTCSCFYNAAVIASSDDNSVDSTMFQQRSACCADVPRILGTECCCGEQLSSDYKIPVCMHVGEELRKIVECFRIPTKNNENISTDDEVGDAKGTSYLSQFGRTMFTAALLLIGWKLLRQN